jgi:hypothetical protein
LRDGLFDATPQIAVTCDSDSDLVVHLMGFVG